jgi:hypothetical protein
MNATQRIEMLEKALRDIATAKPADAHYDARSAVIYYQRIAQTALDRYEAAMQPTHYVSAR